jgi:GWxTD domain-containing protein
MRWIWLTISYIFLIGSLFAQKSELQLDVDYAQFRGVGDSLYVEMYYSFSASGLSYDYRDDGFVGSVELEVNIYDSDMKTEPVQKRSFRMNYAVEDTTHSALNQTVVGLSGFFIKPGDYTLRVKGYDIGSPEQGDSVTFPLRLTDVPEKHIAVSDLQFANSIRQIPEDNDNTFYKNTLEVIPNPSRIFGVGHPILFYYLEVYNLLASGDIGDEYNIRTAVYDAVGNQYYEREHSKNRRHESSVEVGTINTSAFKSGTYTLTIAIADPAASVMVNSSRRFFVFNPHHGISDDAIDRTPEGVVASSYAVMSEEELDKEFEQMRYITTSQDRQAYGRLQTRGEKQRFLFEYWRRIDPDPISPDNPVRTEYLSRVHHANQQFGFGFREGWRSDRGRVFITYGPPDEYERYPSRSDSKPYEIWYFNNIQGGVVFVFVDRTGFQDYQLVHSTHRNELRDENWREYIRQN